MADLESRMNRFRVGDKVAYEDVSEWPPVHMEGEVTGFDNEECTYLVVEFEDDVTKVLTEDEVNRIG